ncbi:2'-5' RNA ligase family protein [Actinopolyspora sp. H202]|uniref:2'-5' RNA ligase family protein n=1 Tax=Actinopolyspora sp. H202 TaxID=1500456 RepID=UPI003EE59A32
MRLFTAFWPSEAAVADLAAVVGANRGGKWPGRAERLRGFRPIPPSRWHMTLCFHGDDADPDTVAARLRAGVAELHETEPDFALPPLCLAGAGTFRGALWVGVVPENDVGSGEVAPVLRRVALLAGADVRRFRPHVTIARWSGGRVEPDRLTDRLNSYVGPAWSAGSFDVVASERHSGMLTYRTVYRVPLNPR